MYTNKIKQYCQTLLPADCVKNQSYFNCKVSICYTKR